MVSAPPSSRARGFTLVELLVVLAIIATVAGIVGPGLGTLWERLNTAHPADELALQLRTARAEASRSGLAVRFELNPTNGAYLATVRAGAADSVIARGSITNWESGGRGGLGGRGGWGGQTAATSAVRFFPSGTASPGRWVWDSEGESAVVRVEAWGGKISVLR